MARTLSRRARPVDDDETDAYLDDNPAEDEEPARGSRRGERRGSRAEREPEPERGRTRRSNRFADIDPDEDDDREPRDADVERLPNRRASRSSRRSEPAPRDTGRGRGRSLGSLGSLADDDDDRGARSERRSRSARSEPRGGREQRSSRLSDRRDERQGWGGYRQTADSVRSDFADALKIVDNTDMLIKLLEAEPVTSYAEHWLTIGDGRRSFVCLGDGCPICDRLGDRPSVKVCMNVADMDVDPPVVKMWTFGSQVGDILEKFASNPKTSPVSRDDLYWTIVRTKKNDRYTTTVRPVKARDLVEDFDTEPLTDEELDELDGQLFTEDQVFTVKSKSELIKVITDNDLEDSY